MIDLTPLRQLDDWVLRWVWSWPRHGALHALMWVLTWMGSGYAMLLIPPVWVRPRSRAFAVALTRALLLAAVTAFLLKRVFHRVRPCAYVPFVDAGLGAPTDFSLPSGHATGSFAFAAFVIAALNPGARRNALAVVLFGLACGVALSRVYLGVHFPTDVTAGALLGTSVGWHFGRRYRQTPLAPDAQQLPSL